MPRDAVVAALRAGGFVAAEAEAGELLAAAGPDATRLAAMLERRLAGEPLAWIVGGVTFCGVRLAVHTGVYVPRPHSEALARAAAAALPEDGVAVDVCTGCGAVAAAVAARRPAARVVATDVDERAVANARANGVEAYVGALSDPIPLELAARVDVLTGVVPYVPTAVLPLLQRDTFAYETRRAYDGGADGTDLLRRVLHDARRWLRPGGLVLLEVGGDQAELVAPLLPALGYRAAAPLVDEDGDPRALVARFDP